MPVLVVEDSISVRLLTVGILEEQGLSCVEAESGEEAVAYMESGKPLPSLVILDVGLPGIDGYETGKRIKELAYGHHLPIIFLTGARDEDILSRCLSIGDDYIPKPFSVEVLCAKVVVHRRVSRLYKVLAEQNAELKTLQHRTELEHKIVEAIFTNQFAQQITETDNFHYHISPMSVFNGDVLLSAEGPSGNRYVVVGDVTGHGLPAAVGALPVYQTFRTMAAKGMSVGAIAAEMNRSLLGLMPDNMMLAASVLELNNVGDTLTVWSGGMPPMVIADNKGTFKELIKPRHCPLAMLEEYEFSQDVQVFHVDQDDRVYLYTDGVEESRNAAGEMFGEERIYELFNGQQEDMFNHILQRLGQFVGEGQQDDDITLVELRCIPNESFAGSKRQAERVRPIPWSITFNLGWRDIKASNPVPQIIKLVGNSVGLDVHQDYISTILSEIYGNALEHGLLGLDSALKDTEDGFMEYYRLRQQRLEALDSGFIYIAINYFQGDAHPQVEIEVSDSGPGFDYQALAKVSDDKSFGRGVSILNELCDNVAYSDGGRTINVIYGLKG